MKKEGINLLKSLIRSRKKRIKGDIFIPLTAVSVAAFGLLMIYSASYYSAGITYGDKFFFVKKQAVGFLLGIAGMIAVNLFDYNFLRKLGYPLIIIAALLLVLVLTPLGVENYGAKRWIGIGSLTVQPSELAKFCFAVFAAGYFSADPSRASRFTGILPVLLSGGAQNLCIFLS